MSVLENIACMKNRRDEVPNQELAKQLAEQNNSAGIREIVENLRNSKADIQNDCIKILYEIGYQKPELIAEYWQDFLKLLKSRNNRLVWGGMLALATISRIKADDLYSKRGEIINAINHGSVITIDNGIRTLAGIASTSKTYREDIFPILLNHLKTCRPKEVPQHCESILCAVDCQHAGDFIEVLMQREEDLIPSQINRVRKVLRAVEGLKA